MSLAPQEQNLAAQIGFDLDILSLVLAELPVELRKLELKHYRYEDRDDTPEEERFDSSMLSPSVQIARNVKVEWTPAPLIEMNMDGLFFEVPVAVAIPLILKFRSAMTSKGYMPIALDYSYRKQLLGEDFREALANSRDSNLIGIVKFSNHYDILKFSGTSAGNYDMGNQDIINKLKDWERLCEFEILGSGGDKLSIAFKTIPEDLMAFAEDVDRFCPDIMGQGYVGEPLGESATMEDFARAMDEQTLEDLAEYIKRNKALHFWWD